jgi:hypothetical protein
LWQGFSTNKKLKELSMRQTELWGFACGIDDVSYRADDADYLPPASGWFGWGEGSF